MLWYVPIIKTFHCTLWKKEKKHVLLQVDKLQIMEVSKKINEEQGRI